MLVVGRFTSIVERLTALSVNLNGLIVPGSALPHTLGRHATNLVVLNDHAQLRVSLVGSATAVCLDGRYVLLCSKHQIANVNPENIAMFIEGGARAITSSGTRWFAGSDDTDAYDIAAFDFTAPVKDHPELKGHFYHLVEGPPDVASDKVVAVLLTGFPSSDQKYDLWDRNHLGLVRRQVTCVLDGQPADPALLRLKALAEGTPADGLSGGSAFAVLEINGKFRAYFSGLVLRGGGGFFHILKAGFVIAFLTSTLQVGQALIASGAAPAEGVSGRTLGMRSVDRDSRRTETIQA